LQPAVTASKAPAKAAGSCLGHQLAQPGLIAARTCGEAAGYGQEPKEQGFHAATISHDR